MYQKNAGQILQRVSCLGSIKILARASDVLQVTSPKKQTYCECHQPRICRDPQNGALTRSTVLTPSSKVLRSRSANHPLNPDWVPHPTLSIQPHEVPQLHPAFPRTPTWKFKTLTYSGTSLFHTGPLNKRIAEKQDKPQGEKGIQYPQTKGT